MSWQILIILQSVLVATSVICLRFLARDKPLAKASFAVNGGLYVILYLSVLSVVPWLGHFSAHIPLSYWLRFVFGGLAFALTNVFTYKTLVYFDAAISTITSSGLGALLTIIGAAMALKENLSAIQVLGGVILMVAVFYGVLATQYSRRRANHKFVLIGSGYALLAGLTFAAAVVNEKSLLEHMSIATYGVFGIGGQMLMALLLALVIQPAKLKLVFKPRIRTFVFLGGLFRGLGGVCFILAEVRSNNVALVSVISNFKLIIVILLGWWLLKERRHILQKLTAAIIAILGLTIMLWT